MTATTLYANVTGCSGIISIAITNSHDSAVATANITVHTTTLTVNSPLTIDMGYSGNHAVLFTGYAKSIQRELPQNTYTIVASDVMVRAVDYFIASENPMQPLEYKSIWAEDLILSLMQLASLAGPGKYDFDPTYMFFGNYSGVEFPFWVNQVSVLDYCKTISDNLTWNLWVDANEVVHFKHRLPYVMDADNPGPLVPPYDIDVPLAGYQLTDVISINDSYTISEKDLRNKIIIYGFVPIVGIASAKVKCLPDGYYKTISFGLDTIYNQEDAQKMAEYNLDLFTRLTESIKVTIVGDVRLNSRIVISINSNLLGSVGSGNWYVFGCTHNLSKNGFTTDLDLRRMVSNLA